MTDEVGVDLDHQIEDQEIKSEQIDVAFEYKADKDEEEQGDILWVWFNVFGNKDLRQRCCR